MRKQLEEAYEGAYVSRRRDGMRGVKGWSAGTRKSVEKRELSIFGKMGEGSECGGEQG